MRCQHIKVGLADPHDQVLVGRQQLGLCQLKHFHALLVLGRVRGPVQGVRGAQSRILGAITAVRRGPKTGRHRNIGLRHARSQRHRGQVECLGLIGPELVGFILRFGRLVGRIKRACRLVQIDQALGVNRQGGCGQCSEKGGGQRQFFHGRL